jgi:23S rRNA pseudouridine1911/1915/1917 synthase
MGNGGRPKETDPALLAQIRDETKVDRRLSRDRRRIAVTVGRGPGVGWRIDRYLAILCPTLSRSLLRRWIDDGYCSLDGRPAGAADRTKAGSELVLDAPLPPTGDPIHDDPPDLRVLYEEEGFLACAKPAGQLPHQAGRILRGTLLNQIQDLLEARGVDPEEARLVNRIDRDTSGIVLVGTDADTHTRLCQALERREVEKEYLALCRGIPEEEHGHWRAPIGDGPAHSIARVVRPDGQACHTEFRVEASASGCSLLRIRLHTGRQHQIRVHAAHAGHPLLGDWVYGAPCEELPGQALHAAGLTFEHPSGQGRVSIEAVLDPAIASLWKQLQGGQPPTPRPLLADEARRLDDRKQAQERRLPQWLSADAAAKVRQEFEG